MSNQWLRWCLAFLIPFLIAFALLVNHQKNLALDDLQRSPQLGQIMNQPGEELEAWKMGAKFTAVLATPVGLLGVFVYGSYLLISKLRRK